MSMFTKGDKVYCRNNGWGVVDEIAPPHEYPVCVIFNNTNIETYTENGKLYDNSPEQGLFFGVPQHVEAPQKPMPAIPVDTKIYVKDSMTDDWTPRYFKRWSNDRAACFDAGATSWSSSGRTCTWKYWRIP